MKSFQSIFPFFFSLLIFSVFLPLSAQTRSRTQKIVLPSLNIDLGGSKQAQEELKPEKVIIDKSNIAVLDAVSAPAKSKKRLTKTALHRQARWTKRPKGSLADKLAPANAAQRILWFPRWGGNYANGTNVDDAFLSPDKSIIVFLERIGEDPGPYATRVVFYDTHSWQILQIKDLEEIYAKKGVWVSGNNLALLCTGQKSRHTKDSLAVYDPFQRKLLSQCPVTFSPGKHFVSENERFLLLSENKPSRAHLYQYDPAKKQIKEIKIFEDFLSEPVLAAKASERKFFLCDRDFLYVCRLSDRRINEKFPLPERADPFLTEKILPLNNGTFLLLPSHSSGARAGYFKDKKILPIGSPSSGMALEGFSGDSFIAGFSKGGEFAIYHQASLERLNFFSANNARPRTRGTVVFAFTIPHANSIAVLDSRGTIYLLYPDRANKRYLKEILTKKLQ